MINFMRNKIAVFTAMLFFALLGLAGKASAANMDLFIKDVSFLPTQPIVGVSIKIIIKGKYAGDVNLTSSYGVDNVAFAHSNFQQENSSQTGASVAPSTASPLIPGSSFTYTIVGKFTDAGEKLLVFKIDGANQLAESNENNNTFNKLVKVMKDGDLIKLADSPAVYIMKADGKKHLFANEPTFWSYYTGAWSNLKQDGSVVFISQVSQADFDFIPIGNNITVKPGSKLIRFSNSPRIYLVYNGNRLKYIAEQLISKKFGDNWKNTLVTIQGGFENDYDRSDDSQFIDDDGDGVSNNDESFLYKTNPNNHDSDGDGYSDGTEILNGYNPNGSGKL